MVMLVQIIYYLQNNRRPIGKDVVAWHRLRLIPLLCIDNDPRCGCNVSARYGGE